MYTGMLHLHNLLRWVVLILLLVNIFKAFTGMTGNKPFTNGDKKTGLFLLISAHLQLLIGLYQWFTGPWGLKNIQNPGMGAVMGDPVNRFWAVEHFVGMLFGIILITLGRGIGKRNLPDTEKHKRTFWVYLIALIIIMAVIPWPFRENIAVRFSPV